MFRVGRWSHSERDCSDDGSQSERDRGRRAPAITTHLRDLPFRHIRHKSVDTLDIILAMIAAVGGTAGLAVAVWLAFKIGASLGVEWYVSAVAIILIGKFLGHLYTRIFPPEK